MKLLELFLSAPEAFWRHDVDVDLKASIHIAQVAQVAGISSTFYLMPRSNFYNLFSPEGSMIVNHLSSLGHRLGIHVDYQSGDVADTVVTDQLLIHVAYRELFDLDAVSFHMPPQEVLWKDFDTFENAYASRWRGHYVADSRGEWTDAKETALAQHVADGTPVQVNLHPEHWAS